MTFFGFLEFQHEKCFPYCIDSTTVGPVYRILCWYCSYMVPVLSNPAGDVMRFYLYVYKPDPFTKFSETLDTSHQSDCSIQSDEGEF